MVIDESLKKILSRDEIVADLFYEIFLDRYPEVRDFFVDVDLKRQAVLLTMTLVLMELHYRHVNPATEQYLKLLGRKHQAWDIPAELYPKFRGCLLDTLKQFHGRDWKTDLATQWGTAIDQAVETMLSGYQLA